MRSRSPARAGFLPVDGELNIMLREDATPAHHMALGGASRGMVCFGRHLPRATPNVVLPHFPSHKCSVLLATMSDEDERNREQVTAHDVSIHPDVRMAERISS